MKRFLKLNAFALVALLFLGVADAWGLGIKKNVALNLQAELSQANGGTGTWNSNTKKLEWSQAWSNLFYLTDWKECDLSGYDKMVIDVKSASRDKAYRVVIAIDGVNYTYSTTGAGIKTINIKTDFKDNRNRKIESVSGNPLSNVRSIRIGGNSDKGNIVINSIYFHKPLQWDANNKITFSAQDFNLGGGVTVGNPSNKFTFANQWNGIYLEFDNDGLNTTELESVNWNINGSNIYQVFEQSSNNWKDNLTEAQQANIKLGWYRICTNSNNNTITVNSVVFVKKKPKYVFDVTQGRLYFEDFENKTQASLHPESEAPAVNTRPENNQVGKYYLYGGRGKILKDPTFGQYYQNLADADEYTKSLSQNFLRYIFTDDERKANVNAIRKSGAATIGFWVNGQVAVDYELPLERGSMFCIFSNDCFAKADAGQVREKDRPRFMFDLSCNGWVYSYMPNTTSEHEDIGINYFFYGEKYANSGVQNPLESLFGKDNYTNTLDQSQHKFYDDRKWHYVTYVMDNQLTRVQIYLDGVLTGTVENVTNLPTTNHSECQFEDLVPDNDKDDRDYIGRTEYLRNIVLGGLTPHGLFYDQQYYSDAALAYDDIAMYGRALTQDEIRSIIEQKNYTPNEWHYGDSFAEYNASKGGHENPHDVSGLGVASSFNNNDYLEVKANTTITIPSVPKNYYVRVEYYSGNKDSKATSSKDNTKLAYIGCRDNKITTDTTHVVATYKAIEAGTYLLDVKSDILIRSIVITPYQYADLKFGNWNSKKTAFTALNKNSKYKLFNVKRIDGKNIYYNIKSTDGATVIEELGENPTLPEISLIIDGKRNTSHAKVYEEISEYLPPYSQDHPYIKFSSTAPHVAHINENGNITMTGIAGNTTIIAELISDNLYNGSEIVDSFEIRIKKEENTFRLENKQIVNVNEKYPTIADSDKNLENITLTLGGWDYNKTYNIPGKGDVKDSWSKVGTWRAPYSQKEILDEFTQYTNGGNPARSESLGRDEGVFYPKVALKNNITPWTLPCRGAYVKFEPTKAGIVTMYLLQNGNLDNVVGEKEDPNQHSSHVYWRPVYITDETGKVVDFVQTATNGRITKNDNFFIGDKRRAQFIEGIAETYNENLREDLINLKNTDADKFHTLIDNWNNAAWRQKVIPTGDGGYMVMSKAIVRYTFNVYPGKTYYVFSNESQIAFSGFNFEEGRLLDTKTQYYETAPVRDVVESGQELHFTDVLNAQQPTIPTGGADITHVTYERNFAQGKWSSICLPFSMNNRQMREQFGEETTVVLLNNIHDDGKIDLIWHVNQDIIAGYPYFILPRGEVKHDNVANSTITKIAVDTYFNSEIKKENPLFSIGSNGETFLWQSSYNGDCYKTEYPYVFEGNYHNEFLPAGSYVMSNSGNLSKLKNATTAKPFRAYLKYQGSNPNNAKPLYTSISWQGEQTTSIDELIFQNGILTESSDVYGIDGTVVRHDAQNLSNLSKGVYIVNGKKFVVK